jgi:hypothetical protein
MTGTLNYVRVGDEQRLVVSMYFIGLHDCITLVRLKQGSAIFSLLRAALGTHIFVGSHRKELMSWTVSETVFI